MPEVLGTIRVPTWRLTCSQKHSLKIYIIILTISICFFASLALRHWLTDLLMDSQNTLSVLSLWPDSTYNLTSSLTISQSLTIIQAFHCANMSWFLGLLVCSRSFHHQLCAPEVFIINCQNIIIRTDRLLQIDGLERSFRMTKASTGRPRTITVSSGSPDTFVRGECIIGWSPFSKNWIARIYKVDSSISRQRKTAPK